MANKTNLRTLSPSEARQQGAKGGKASAAKRRKLKSMRDVVKYLLESKVGDVGLVNEEGVKKLLERFGLDGDDRVATLASAAIVNGAITGSPQMAKLLLDLTVEDEKGPPAPAKVIVTFDDNEEETPV